ncbi:DUF4326 domain-containing protein [Micromonospora sp. NPDC047134]|uniref:DUF4326 domain-containing protein n=1 Tax=Micromonospora sp. NPDC047134 TaxID=3154340 RepID=UPI003400B895
MAAGVRRVQRRRSAGWRMPTGAVYVGRPSRFGNPFTVGVDAVDRADAVAKFAAWLVADPVLLARVRRDLAGRSLACWCPLTQPCHADVLIVAAAGGDVRGWSR